MLLVVTVCMFGAQQAAYTHYVGHIASDAHGASAPAGDGDEAPLHACATCAVFAGLAAAPPSFISPIAVANAAASPLPDIPAAYIPARSALPYTARAPPAFL